VKWELVYIYVSDYQHFLCQVDLIVMIWSYQFFRT